MERAVRQRVPVQQEQPAAADLLRRLPLPCVSSLSLVSLGCQSLGFQSLGFLTLRFLTLRFASRCRVLRCHVQILVRGSVN